MSRLDELIQKLCPNGVPFKHLWEVTAWDKKFNAVDRKKQAKVIDYHYFLAGDLKNIIQNDGDIKILTTNNSNVYTKEEYVEGYISEGEIVCLPWGGNPIIQYYKGRFVTADNRIATSLDENILSIKFLYYVLVNKLDLISSFYRGSGIKHPDMSKVLDISIPVPPMEVQCEIVRILDNFTELTAELKTELTARKKQYAFYSNSLFGNSGTEYQLSDILISLKTGLNPRKFFQLNTNDADKYYVTVRELGKNEVDYTTSQDKINSFAKERINQRSNLEIGDVLFSGTGTIGKVSLVSKDPREWDVKEGVYILKPDMKFIYPKYLMYLMRSEYAISKYILYKVGSPVVSVPMKDLIKVKFKIPSLEEQQKSITVMDLFDSYSNDLSQGLPAEIEARQKQYEYYRDKLLTFKKLEV